MDLQKIKILLNKNIETVLTKLDIKYEIFSDNIYAVCPIHDGSDNPRGFSYSIQRGTWKCWTRECQQHYNNDVFGLIRGVLSNKNGVDVEFKDCLKWACQTFKIKSEVSETVTVEEEEDDFCNLISIFKPRIDKKKHKIIQLDKDIKYPSKYFIGRGFQESTIRHFGVGDCTNKSSKMCERAIIPIHDDSGENVVAILGRATKEYRLPKFLFSDEFNKVHFFYNYHRAIDRVKDTGCLFLLEGQGDVWRMYEAGVINCMGIFGKTISKEQQDKLLKMPATHIIILTDNDQAGRESKVHIQRLLNRSFKLTFPKMPNKDIGDMSVQQIQNIILPQLKGCY
jgi:5S rRNA maturation endonuclease (ribonuclease M5)